MGGVTPLVGHFSDDGSAADSMQDKDITPSSFCDQVATGAVTHNDEADTRQEQDITPSSFWDQVATGVVTHNNEADTSQYHDIQKPRGSTFQFALRSGGCHSALLL